MRLLLRLLCAVQAILALRVILRLLRSAGGEPIRLVPEPPPADAQPSPDRVSVLVPVLNERTRLGPCLGGLIMQGPEVAEILVVDGGSVDGTTEMVREAARADSRVRLLQPAPAADGLNGKARDLDIALREVDERSAWVLTVDADVRPRPGLVRSVVARARRDGATVVSVAASQEVAGLGVGWVHPALLATLVYRFGIPGQVARRPADAQANGQCMLLDRAALVQLGGFAASAHSLAEDVTTARLLADQGHPVGFYECDGLVSTRMYETGPEAWRDWGRSLPLRDGLVEGRVLVGLLEVLLVQALPGALLVLARLLATAPWQNARQKPTRAALSRGIPTPSTLIGLNVGLVLMRLGVLIGTRRAYLDPPWSYWLSPLLDLPVALSLMRSAARRDHVWRGRPVRREPIRLSHGTRSGWQRQRSGWQSLDEPVQGGVS